MNSFSDTPSYDNKDLVPALVNDQSKESCVIPVKFLEKENISPDKNSLDHPTPEENSKVPGHSQSKNSRFLLPIYPKLPNICKHLLSDSSSIHLFESKLEESKTQNGSKDMKNQFSEENLEKNPISSEKALRLSRLHFERGNQAFFSGRYSSAKKQYKKAIKFDPNFFEALYNLAMSFYLIPNRAKAIEYLKKANKIKRTSIGFKLLGQLPINCRENIALKRKLFMEALKLDPSDSEVYLLLGNMYAEFQNLNKPKQFYYKVIEMCEIQENSQTQGDLLDFSDEWEISVEPFSQEFSTVNNESQEKDFESMFGRGLEKAKTGFKAYFNGAQLLVRKGLFDKAMKTYQEIEAKYPECRIPVYYKMAQLYILEKKFLDAAKMFAKVFVPPKKNAGEFTEKQISHLESIDKMATEAHKKHARRGHFFIQIGKLEEALTEFQASYALAPNHYLSNWHLAQIYIYLGRIDDAEAMLRKAHSINRKTSERLGVIGVYFDSSIKTLQT